MRVSSNSPFLSDQAFIIRCSWGAFRGRLGIGIPREDGSGLWRVLFATGEVLECADPQKHETIVGMQNVMNLLGVLISPFRSKEHSMSVSVANAARKLAQTASLCGYDQIAKQALELSLAILLQEANLPASKPAARDVSKEQSH